MLVMLIGIVFCSCILMRKKNNKLKSREREREGISLETKEGESRESRIKRRERTARLRVGGRNEGLVPKWMMSPSELPIPNIPAIKFSSHLRN